VGINRDASVKRIKTPSRPVVREMDRARVVAGLESVNYVVLFREDTPLKTIMRLRPDVLVKGADWSKDRIVGAGFVRSYGGKVVTLPLAKGRSTTNLIEKIAEIYRKK
jgi:D-beta-D-heptose 7-phosphate kinase/D-beta-D-heptose 1-phosphate adenosyltransferase